MFPRMPAAQRNSCTQIVYREVGGGGVGGYTCYPYSTPWKLTGRRDIVAPTFYKTFGSQMAVRLSDFETGRTLAPERFLVLIAV
jgi:hypothetical protein